MSSKTQKNTSTETEEEAFVKNSNVKITKAQTFIQKMQNWANSNVLFPLPFGTACCALEYIASSSAKYNIEDHGVVLDNYSPEEADLLIIGGTITHKQAPVLKQIYDKMPEPKWVLSMGVCTSSGGLFNSYNVVSSLDEIIPVDVQIYGCPPTPESIIDGVEMIREKIRTGKV